MQEPMLSLAKEGQASCQPQACANLLPCCIDLDGPIGDVSRYWNPTQLQDSKEVSYFRGRRLRGKAIHLSDQSRGVVAQCITDKSNQETSAAGEKEGDANRMQDVETLQVVANFDRVHVWSHDKSANPITNIFMHKIEERQHIAEKLSATELHSKLAV